MTNNIGFMQGRLSPIIDGKIQSFPWGNWESEIVDAIDLGINIMEWTLDQNNLYENPLMNKKGQSLIKKICKKNNFLIPSLTGDCFMQSPFWKNKKTKAKKLELDFLNIVKACKEVGISKIVVPLVDNGRINNPQEKNRLLSFLNENLSFIVENGVKIIFESDYSPKKLTGFIDKLDHNFFGINYDIGNSASLGYDCRDEIRSYGNRIMNVHVKDRILNGATVPLGKGNANFDFVFCELKKISYKGNFYIANC